MTVLRTRSRDTSARAALAAALLLSCELPPLGPGETGSRDASQRGARVEDCVDCPPGVPRWVLRDADGVELNAIARPRCRPDANPNCWHAGFEAPNTIPCVQVNQADGMLIDFMYELETGDLTTACNGVSGFGLRYYPDPDCTPPGYVAPTSPPMALSRWRVRSFTTIEDTLYVVDPTELVYLEGVYAGGACDYVGPGEYPLYPLVPVPDEVRFLLDNPPYTIEPSE